MDGPISLSILEEFLQFVPDSNLKKLLTKLDDITDPEIMIPDFHLSSPLERCFDFANPQAASANLLIEYCLSGPQSPLL